jgi:signal transduction histidine kinase
VRIEERRGQDFEFVSLDAGELARQVVADFDVPNGRSPATLDFPADLPPVRGDRKKLMQAIGNILSNAYKYSPGGGAVAVRLIGEAGRVGIRVTDHGIGMTPEQAARVYERFYRADASGNIPGTGLGMSIVKEIMQLHGGSVAFESRFGIGTTVTLWLPL